MKKILSILLVAVMLLSMSVPAFAVDNKSVEEIPSANTTKALSDYQKIIDKLNEEYGYSMTLSSAIFSKDNSFEVPTKSTLAEFEAQLRKDIESDIAVNNKTKAAIAALGSDVQWEVVPYLGKSYKIPVNVSYRSMQVVDSLYADAISHQMSTFSFREDIESSMESKSSTSQTITSIQAELDPSGNVAFVMTSTISIPSYWRYTNVNSFSYLELGNGEQYIPIDVSRSYLDSSRTVAATFICEHYNRYGVLINPSSSVYVEFSATGDCLTNWPNYTISKTYTNKTYEHIDYFDDTRNCAAYAWGYNGSVGALGITQADLNGCSGLNEFRTMVKEGSEEFMDSHGINATQITSYSSSINTSTQYRIVMRVGYNDINGNGRWDFSANPGYDFCDYHWWMQLGDGTWADKRGDFPTRIVPNTNIYSDPDLILWTYWEWGNPVFSDFYNSTPVYYKVTG